MITKKPPNGGYGWIIVLAHALNGLSTIPILQGFGLIFKESFAALNLSATDTSVIINVNLAFGMILGLINGPLLKIFGYRKVAMVGSIMYTMGVTLTAFANSFALIIISYGLLASIGMCMSHSGFSLATNTYFNTKKKRGRAISLGMTLTGLGSILMPQLASFLLFYYGVQGTLLILGAYSFHSMLGALLLHPVKWHMISVSEKKPLCSETITEDPKNFDDTTDKQDPSNSYEEDETSIISSTLAINNYRRRRKSTLSSINHDIEVGSIYGFDTPLPRQISTEGTSASRLNISYDPIYDIEMSTINGPSKTNLQCNYKESKSPRWNSLKSLDSVHLNSSMKIFDEPVPITKKLTFIDNDTSKNNGASQNMENNSLLNKEANKEASYSIQENNKCDRNNSAIRQILRRVADLYDFNLLRDPIYINIMLGMSIAIFAEINFSMLTPFILADMGLITSQIANVMSIIAIVDLVFRGASSFLGEWLHLSPRMMYMLSLCLLIISRTSLIFTNGFVTIVAVAIGLGAAKGIRSVYMVLVVPSYVPLQKLPNASGIQMLTNGMILMSAGPMLGIIRDITGSYTACIILLNCVTTFTIFIWTVEVLVRWRISARKKSEVSEVS
ncbi:hypothetical protein PUN28_006923 [Cardiocondyla obscurior]|uniref:Major facilitator superfamily (MFS) profile domain-containing protein n=1 Tax=Cardiocondyla obscurior TaxID=286306 RepID=A0AAW2G2Q4_9HYME